MPNLQPLEFREAKTIDEFRCAANLLVKEYRFRKLEATHKEILDEMSQKQCRVFIGYRDARCRATISLILDGPLPIRAVFKKEIDELRASGLKVGEFCFLAQRRSDNRKKWHQASLDLFALMADVFIRVAKNEVDIICINVNPRHVRFYEDYLGFKKLAEGEERYNPKVKAPAVGLIARPSQILSNPRLSVIKTLKSVSGAQ